MQCFTSNLIWLFFLTFCTIAFDLFEIHCMSFFLKNFTIDSWRHFWECFTQFFHSREPFFYSFSLLPLSVLHQKGYQSIRQNNSISMYINHSVWTAFDFLPQIMWRFGPWRRHNVRSLYALLFFNSLPEHSFSFFKYCKILGKLLNFKDQGISIDDFGKCRNCHKKTAKFMLKRMNTWKYL